MRLNSYHEIIGVLSQVKNEGDKIKLVFNICKEIEIPESKIQIEKLKNYIGSRIGLLNDNNEYKIRKIKSGKNSQ